MVASPRMAQSDLFNSQAQYVFCSFVIFQAEALCSYFGDTQCSHPPIHVYQKFEVSTSLESNVFESRD